MDRDVWQSLLAMEERKRGYTDGFKLLFCPWSLIDTADTLFLSLNPGNDPSGEFMRIASDERGNSYLVQRQAKHSPIAEQYRQLLRLKLQVQHRRPFGHRMLRWTDEASTSAARNVA